MILCDEKYPQILDDICSELTAGDVELSFVDANAMREINKKERGIDKSTDVLSFPFQSVLHAPLGCIVINRALVKEKAKELGHSADEECALLFTHGLLHVLGYDHERDNGQMRELEEAVIAKFNLPNSLIVRTQLLFDDEAEGKDEDEAYKYEAEDKDKVRGKDEALVLETTKRVRKKRES